MGEFIAFCLMIGLILVYIVFAISKTFKDHENDVKSLQQRIFELEDEIKRLKK